jgi:hypothetical protein
MRGDGKTGTKVIEFLVCDEFTANILMSKLFAVNMAGK